MKTPADIIILAGQSNAVGFGCGETAYQLKHIDDVYLLYDNQAEGYTKDEKGREFLDISRPWKITVCPAAEGYTGSLAMRFADEYIEAGYLAPGRSLLIVRCAVGSTGFCTNLWGVGKLLYQRMLDLTDEALKRHPDNRVAAFLWHQGECDAFENPDWSDEKRRDAYHAELKALIEGVRTHIGSPTLPFLCGGFTDEWSAGYRHQCDAVIAATKQVCAEVGHARFAETGGLLSNNQKVANGDVIHFCKDAVYEIGRRYFANYREIVK